VRRSRALRVLLAGAMFTAVVSSQVVAQASEDEVELTADLTGKAEVDDGDSDGKGDATLKLKAGKEEVCFELSWKDIKEPTAAHIHKGKKDKEGDVVVTLFESDEPLPDTFDTVKGCVDDVSDKLIDKIADEPEDYYVNIHNEKYPDGAIRGQLEK
jgi:hypothetical protein